MHLFSMHSFNETLGVCSLTFIDHFYPYLHIFVIIRKILKSVKGLFSFSE